MTPGAESQVRRAVGEVGRPLAEGVRSEMEGRFGRSLTGIRVHDGPQADASAQAVAAEAFAVGRHLVFRRGRFTPDSEAGRQLLTHELTHAVQQGLGEVPAGSLRLGGADDPAERQARALAGHPGRLGLSRDPGSLVSPAVGTVSRSPAEESWADLRQRILQGLIALVQEHPSSEAKRVEGLESLFESVPIPLAEPLHALLADGESTDAFGVYFRREFPESGSLALSVLRRKTAVGPPPAAVAAGSSEVTAVPADPSREHYGFDSEQARADPQYVDNFVGHDYFPDSRDLAFYYPNGGVLIVTLESLLAALGIDSELAPRTDPPAGTRPVQGLMVFERDVESGIVFMAGNAFGKAHTPRIFELIAELEEARPDRELWERNRDRIFEAALGMGALGSHRALGGLVVRTGRLLRSAAGQVRGGFVGLQQLLRLRGRAAQLVAGIRKQGGKVVVNLGGTGSRRDPSGAINVNHMQGSNPSDVSAVPNLIQADARLIGKIFPKGSVDEVVSINVLPGSIRWTETAQGAYRILRPGGTVEVGQFGGAGAAEITQAFRQAGFRITTDALREKVGVVQAIRP